MQAAGRRITLAGRAELAVPLAGAAVAAATVAYGLLATASGVELGTPLAPFLSTWAPHVEPSALVAAAALAGGVTLAPRLRSPALSPLRFAAAALALALLLRLVVAAARHGPEGWWGVFQLGHFEAANEYLPALPALEQGVRLFLDTFAEVGPSLSVNAIGHPPGLLLVLHGLGISEAWQMAALTIGVGVASVPLCYLLARALLDEDRARTATLLYAFAPSAMLYGATSADALYATLGLAATVALLARRALALGPVALVVASFFSYANLAVGAFSTLVVARRDGVMRALVLAAACGVALVVFYALLHLATGYDPVGTLRATEGVYREGVASGRPYAFWLFGSPVAFFVALGLPTAWFALRAAGAAFTPALALLAVLAVAAVLGFTKSETERIYLFLVPLACVCAAAALPERALRPALAALAVQALASELLLFTVW